MKNNYLTKQKKPLSDEEVKSVYLSILDAVHNFCESNSLYYSLAYGTLIGAVRHKGFIPWDDDIDILMLRNDYDKFIKMFSHNDSTPFKVVSWETDKRCRYAFAKVVSNTTIKDELGYNYYGIGIDVFPIDKVPCEEKIAKMLYRKQNFLWDLLMLKAMKWRRGRPLTKNITLTISKIFLSLVSNSYIQKHMQENALKYRVLGKDYNLGCLFAPYGLKNVMPREVFRDFITLPFEGKYYFCIKEYDEYLRRLYGDYMQMPPVESRVSHHDYKCYWK